MTEQLASIVGELSNYEVELFNASTEYRQLAEDAARKRATYDVAYATEFLKIKTNGEKTTDKTAEALAVQTVAGQLTSCRIAEALADASKRHLAALDAIVKSVQTRSRLLNTEAELTRFQI
jgi:hypothetical protein